MTNDDLTEEETLIDDWICYHLESEWSEVCEREISRIVDRAERETGIHDRKLITDMIERQLEYPW